MRIITLPCFLLLCSVKPTETPAYSKNNRKIAQSLQMFLFAYNHGSYFYNIQGKDTIRDILTIDLNKQKKNC